MYRSSDDFFSVALKRNRRFEIPRVAARSTVMWFERNAARFESRLEPKLYGSLLNFVRAVRGSAPAETVC
jgi:hypothetical protein